MQLGFFNNVVRPVSNSLEIAGLSYIPNFISDEEHRMLWDAINNGPWMNDLKRRVQHYGYKYDYKKRGIDYSMFLGSLPEWSAKLARQILDKGYMDILPDQLIVNEYQPGQGIADHIDCEPCFDDTVISLSLGASCIMEFKSKGNRATKKEILLEPKSLVVIKSDARYDWTHGIPARENDKWNGQIIPRQRRISLTFRKVIFGEKGR